MFHSNNYLQSILAVIILGMAGSAASAGDVSMSVSSREAYVGSPIQMQISINNASDYEQPDLPQIDGVEVRSAGAPSQSSQVTVINGRRTESRSVVLRYLITPRRAGSFEIPALTFKVDGKNVKTESLRFVATKSETGDLLFVELAGKKDKVFVGQPLEMTLRIYIKPYRDQDHELTLSEGDMWNMISEHTTWGSFQKRIEEMANNRQRPGGKEVLRKNAQGEERAYYMYEIDAQVYPTKAGKISGDDIQIVVNYPTGLGRSRDPFDSFFDDSPFGGGFMSSPFSNRLSVTSARPVVAEATVDTTKVLPVPTKGRPLDYRGAVGQYQIVTQASPVNVHAGDSITLNLGIIGTGPMELVQAPPLSELPELKQFKVSNQPLAGYVQDDSKVFSTTIRPRQAGTTEIPAIPFSFFNPETEEFETVHSAPIAITVKKAESLALDAIVGTKGTQSKAQDKAQSTAALEPSFVNIDTPSVLTSQEPGSAWSWWWLSVILPPMLWVITLATRHRHWLAERMPSLRSPRNRCLAHISTAREQSTIADALLKYMHKLFPAKEAPGIANSSSESSPTIGAVRSAGLYELAAEAELLFEQLSHSQDSYGTRVDIEEQKAAAIDLVNRLSTCMKSRSKRQIRRPQANRDRKSKRAGIAQSLVLLLGLASMSTTVMASETAAIGPGTAPQVVLSQEQREIIFKDANESYREGLSLAKTDVVEAKDLFLKAANKYQLLVDAGISNANLYFNLGNAYLQSDQLGRAIANYERALKLQPDNRQFQANLNAAETMVQTADTPQELTGPDRNLLLKLENVNSILVKKVGPQAIILVLVLSSLTFWGLVIWRTMGHHLSLWKFATLPGLLLMAALVSIYLQADNTAQRGNAVVVEQHLQLHAGDGEQFAEVAKLDSAEGHRVQTLAHRGSWTQIQTRRGQIGWVPDHVLELL
ncbi:Tetratricopeptide repeat protein [Gimesia panareensis]|uniref:Tetratricopeptide repeat protein n=1 Tax=Gimesia panareensis TaxID=2527978 RepID=A0A518FLA1_9PLAN|nr:BatD family protein [Gimesia panareensis]QDV17123.1 Tetratricopeptide repeat protein [Gimesia panareensis]